MAKARVILEILQKTLDGSTGVPTTRSGNVSNVPWEILKKYLSISFQQYDVLSRVYSSLYQKIMYDSIWKKYYKRNFKKTVFPITKYQIKAHRIQQSHPAGLVNIRTSIPPVLFCKTLPRTPSGQFHLHHIPPAIPMTFGGTFTVCLWDLLQSA